MKSLTADQIAHAVKRHYIFSVLVIVAASFLVMRWPRKLSSTQIPVSVAQDSDSAAKKTAHRDLSPILHATPLKKAWERVSNGTTPKGWMPADTAKRRAAKFQDLINDKLKSVDLGIGGEERLVADFELIDDVRNEWEASQVEVVSFSAGELRLHIPAYPEIGKELHAALQSILEQDFSVKNAQAIIKLTGSDLIYEFRGLGTMDQTFTVTTLPEEEGRIRVDWTLRLQQVPDRETLIKTRGVWGGATGTVIYPLSSFDEGPYAALGPSLRKYFETPVGAGKS